MFMISGIIKTTQGSGLVSLPLFVFQNSKVRTTKIALIFSCWSLFFLTPVLHKNAPFFWPVHHFCKVNGILELSIVPSPSTKIDIGTIVQKLLNGFGLVSINGAMERCDRTTPHFLSWINAYAKFLDEQLDYIFVSLKGSRMKRWPAPGPRQATIEIFVDEVFPKFVVAQDLPYFD